MPGSPEAVGQRQAPRAAAPVKSYQVKLVDSPALKLF